MKRNFVSMFVTLGMLILGSLAFAQTDTQTTNATVASVQTFSITGGNSITLTPSLTADVTDSSTTLGFSTNDGASHKISVVAATGGWTFSTTVTGVTTTPAYPVLSFISASTTGGGSGSTSAVPLINGDNTLGNAVDIVTAITNVEGTATVTLGVAQITHAVTAGTYEASLTYTMQ